MKTSQRSEGFSLTELMVVLSIIAVLMAVALPTMLGPKRKAQDTATHATLVAALKTEEIFATDDGTYSSNIATLATLEPSLDWSGGADASLHITLATVVSVDDSVLLYARSNSGTWFGLRYVRAGASAGTDVDDIADCVGHDW